MELRTDYSDVHFQDNGKIKLLIIVGAKKFLSEQTIELPDLSGNHALDKHNFPVYREIIDTINYRGRLLTANDIIGG